MPNVQNEVQEIVEAVQARGFQVEHSGNHFKLYYDDRPVLIEDVPGDRTSRRSVTIPTTPSDSRWRENVMAELRRARVLDEDPKDAGQRGLTPEDEERRAEEREARETRQAKAEEERKTQSEQAQERQKASDALRERAERVLGPLGVWRIGERGGVAKRPRRSVREVARLAFSWANEEDVTPRPPTPSASEQNLQRIYDRQGVSEETVTFFSAFLDLIERANDPVTFYFGMLREHLGLADEEPVAAPEPAAAKPPTGVEPVPVADEDDLRVRELRERLEEVRRDADARVMAAQEAYEASLNEKEEEYAELAKERERVEAELELAQAASTNGTAKIPEIAFEALGEMIGAYVVVGEQEDLAEALRLVAKKKENAVELAKRIAALEMGVEVEA